jgi:hypothetical protein
MSRESVSTLAKTAREEGAGANEEDVSSRAWVGVIRASDSSPSCHPSSRREEELDRRLFRVGIGVI